MTTERRAVSGNRYLLFWSIALGGLAFDLFSKSWAFERVGPPGSPAVPIVPNILELRTTYNKGALWGFGNAFEYSSLVFAALSVVAAGVIIYWLFWRGGAHDRLLTIALALITGGAIGNCYDRVRFGHVRDFVHFHVDSIGFNFAIFNFADNLLVVGAGLLILLALRPEPGSEPLPSQSHSTEAEAHGGGEGSDGNGNDDGNGRPTIEPVSSRS